MEEVLLFDQTIQQIELLFRYIGINIRSGEQTVSRQVKCRIIFFLNLFWLSCDSLGAIYWFIDAVRTQKEFLEITYIAPCISLTFMALIKGIFLMVNEKNVHNLIENLRNLECQNRMIMQSDEKIKIIKEEKKFLDLILKTFNILHLLLIITFNLCPLVIIAVKYFREGEVELILPFLVLYPFDPYQIKVWPFIYVHQFWSACVVCLCISSCDLFFFTCCTYIRAHFRLLQQDLKHVIKGDGNTKISFKDEGFEDQFKDLIKRHQDLIDSANILEVIYSKSTLFNFISSSLVICLTGFNVTIMMNDDVSYVVIFVSFLCIALVQIFFMCYFADLLMTSSSDIGEAVYNSEWYMADAEIGKNLLLVLIRSQSPCKITASGFAKVNLLSFMRVLSTSYSYFALLQTMYRG